MKRLVMSMAIRRSESCLGTRRDEESRTASADICAQLKSPPPDRIGDANKATEFERADACALWAASAFSGYFET
jgi:hypothetical protein